MRFSRPTLSGPYTLRRVGKEFPDARHLLSNCCVFILRRLPDWRHPKLFRVLSGNLKRDPRKAYVGRDRRPAWRFLMLTAPSVTVTTDALPAEALAGIIAAAEQRAMLVAEMRDALIQQDVMLVYAVAHRVCGVVL